MGQSQSQEQSQDDRRNDIGWVFVYLGAFGISDYIVNKLQLRDMSYIFYYMFLLLFGFYILYYYK